jgi:predicted NBD/HSP70 family sugar kinase
MYYIGINIGKNFHEACLVDQTGKLIVAPFQFSNSRSGFNLLREKIAAFPGKDCFGGRIRSEILKWLSVL